MSARITIVLYLVQIYLYGLLKEIDEI